MKFKGTSVSPSLSVDQTSISTLLCSNISPYLFLPQPVRSVHFSIEPFRGHIALEALVRGQNGMLGVGWLPHQPSHAFDGVSTPVIVRALVIVIPPHILESV